MTHAHQSSGARCAVPREFAHFKGSSVTIEQSARPMSDQTADYSALERLLVTDSSFEQLERMLGGFNIFEAVGVVRQELRHSQFLAFLLDPNQPHGLGDAFVTRFLQRAIQGAERDDLPVTPVDLDLWSLGSISVLREWLNIDVVLLSETH